MNNKWLYAACVIVISGITLVGCGEVEQPTNNAATPSTSQSNAPEESKNEQPVDTQDAVANVDWSAEVKKIADGDGSATEKADSVEKLARDYKPTSDEITAFQTRIVDEFINNKYLSDKDNAEYMLTNLFQSVVVERQADESQGMKKYASSFYKNTKYVFRGAETPDSDSVKLNEEKMKKLINGK